MYKCEADSNLTCIDLVATNVLIAIDQLAYSRKFLHLVTALDKDHEQQRGS